MRRNRWMFALLLVGLAAAPKRALGASQAEAAPRAPGDVVAEGEPETKVEPIFPVKLEASTDGSASAQFGVGALREFPNVPVVLGFVFNLELSTSDGLATLLALDSNNKVVSAPTGRLGLSLFGARLQDEKKLPYPILQIKTGGHIGRQEFTYLEGDSSTPRLLTPRETTKLPWDVAVSAIGVPEYVFGDALTIDGLTAFRSRWQASPVRASWCVPRGNVLRGPDPAAGSDPATSCQSAALGAPAHSNDLVLRAHVGVADKDGRWRIAFGGGATFPVNEGAPEKLRLSMELPIYAQIWRLLPEGASRYQGLTRLTPEFHWSSYTDGSKDTRFLLTLSFLGQRGLFEQQLEKP